MSYNLPVHTNELVLSAVLVSCLVPMLQKLTYRDSNSGHFRRFYLVSRNIHAKFCVNMCIRSRVRVEHKQNLNFIKCFLRLECIVITNSENVCIFNYIVEDTCHIYCKHNLRAYHMRHSLCFKAIHSSGYSLVRIPLLFT